MTKPTEHNPKTSPATPAPSKAGGDAASSAKGIPPTTAAAAASPPRPKSWSEIRVGSLVIAQESLADGWWEATVTEVRDDILTLRWRDYPRLPVITRSRKEVALLFSTN